MLQAQSSNTIKSKKHNQQADTPDAQRLLSTKQAAIFLGIAPQTLAVWRTTKRYAIPYIKMGKIVRYQLDDLAAHVAANKRGTTVSTVGSMA